MKSLIKMGFYGPPFLLQNAVLEFSIAADPEVPEDQDERETDTEIRKEARVNYREFSRAQYREGDREGQRELADDHVLKTQSKKSATSVVNVFNSGNRKHDLGGDLAIKDEGKGNAANGDLLKQFSDMIDKKLAVLEDKMLLSMQEQQEGKPITGAFDGKNTKNGRRLESKNLECCSPTFRTPPLEVTSSF
jgi:hypothetical protein